MKTIDNNHKLNRYIANATQGIRHVFIHDLKIQALIGIHPNEKQELQPIIINIDLGVEEIPIRKKDRVDDIICYEKIYNQIQTIIQKGHINLIETLAEKIAKNCLSFSKHIISVRIRIEKTNALQGTSSVGIEIERFAC